MIRTTLLLLAVAVFSTGCGLKGDLYLEEEVPAEDIAPADETAPAEPAAE